jgi:HlyD family secretion protein
MNSTAEVLAETSVQRNLWFGLAAGAVLVVGLGGWAAFAKISGAVIAAGTVVVESNVKKVQHPTGGIVGELRVREGDGVQAGAVLIRLDETLTRTELAIASNALDDLTARRARLEAELESRGSIAFPPVLMQRATDPDVIRRMNSETLAFDQGRIARDGQKKQLMERIAQLTESIDGYDVRQKAKVRERELIERELSGARDLWSKGLLPISKLTALEREAASLDGDRGQLMSLIAEARAKIAETELQILQVDHELRGVVGRELRETQSKIDELTERKIAAEDKLSRVEIRAPQSGLVHQLAVHTIGGIVAAGETIMLIVPDGEQLTVEVRIAPADIDQIQPEHKALLRFSAFNQQTTPELTGSIERISADVQTDSLTGRTFYVARISISDEERARLGNLKLVPGMPVEAFIQTGDRNVLSYLMKPILDQTERAFRDQ